MILFFKFTKNNIHDIICMNKKKRNVYMEKYRDMTLRKKSNLKMIRNLVFFIGLIIFTFWFIFKDQDINVLISTLKSTNLIYILISALLMLGVYLMETINVRCVLISLGEKKLSILRVFKYTCIGNFFSAITPAATGGQPVEVYYMNKDGIETANGTMAMLMQLCGFQSSILILSILGAILNPSLLSGSIMWFYILGLTINGIALLLMILGAFNEKAIYLTRDFLVKIMFFFKVRNSKEKTKKLDLEIKKYIKSAKLIRNNKTIYFKSVLRVFIQICIYHSIPYFVYRSFGLNDLSFIELFTMQAILYTTVSGIPLPGSIGVSETLFLKLYGAAFGKTLLSGAMLLYRFVSFYLYIMIFSIVVIVTAVKTKEVYGTIDKNVIEIEKDFK